MSESPEIGEQYTYSDGTIEIVFVVEDGRILTVREYPERELFDAAVADARQEGINEAVANLPDVKEFTQDDDG
ncbi:hypothetical protein [Halalkalirubrum salinum]|uniref:hypothetical protein n=1 Tax=Halalkalirubrum salinum TaxID=2563889 RepID=UPI0010FAFF8D|nr:hypothetical protein [Halalkalirubrum salinum]